MKAIRDTKTAVVQKLLKLNNSASFINDNGYILD